MLARSGLLFAPFLFPAFLSLAFWKGDSGMAETGGTRTAHVGAAVVAQPVALVDDRESVKPRVSKSSCGKTTSPAASAARRAA